MNRWIVPPQVRPDGERLVVGVAERDHAAGAARLEDVERLGDDRALDAATRHRAGHLAVLADGHGRARDRAGRSPRCRRPGRWPPACRPARQRSMSSRISFTRAITSAELLQRGQRVALHEVVNIRQGGRHSPRQRRVAGRHLQRVHPHHPVGDPVEAGHLLGQHLGVAPVPAVGEDHDDGAAGHAPHAPLVVEPAQALAEPGAAATSRAPARRPGARARSGSRELELAGDAGEAGAEGERLDPLAAGHRGVDEAQQRPGVGLHRAGDVEQQDEPPRPLARLAVAAADRLASGPQRGVDGAAQVGPALLAAGGPWP